jgi:hypothetical protein
MSNARNLADLLDSNGDVVSGALDNAVPADGSITTAKLASTLDLSGKTVNFGLASADMPSGTIIQTVVNQWNTHTSVSSFSGSLFSTNITIQAGSKIVIAGDVARYTNAAGGTWGQAFQYNLWLGAYAGGLLADQEHSGENVNNACSFQTPIHGQTGTLPAGTYTITLGGQSVVNTSTHEFNRTPRSSWMILYEVKA